MGELEGRVGGGGGQEHVAYVGGCGRGGWRDDGGSVCVCAGGVTARSLLCQHPNIMLVKKNNP